MRRGGVVRPRAWARLGRTEWDPYGSASLADPSAGGESATQGEEAGAVASGRMGAPLRTYLLSSQCFLAQGLPFGLCVSRVSHAKRLTRNKTTPTPIKPRRSSFNVGPSVYKTLSLPARISSVLFIFSISRFFGVSTL